MSTVITPFTPSANAPFTFQAVLDGTAYTVTVYWGLFGQRWYISITTSDNVLIKYCAMVGSPNGYNINLVAGRFTSQLVFRAPSQQFEVIG